MELYRNARPDMFPQGSAVAIGNFEGLHIGHQAIINKLVNVSRALGVPSVVMTFEPSPKQYFIGKVPLLRLMSLSDKLEGLRQLGVDTVLCLRFNEAFSKVSSEAFIQHYLQDALSARHIIVGDDFRFGENRSGDIALLKAKGKALQFDVTSLPQVSLNSQRVSSTWIREQLSEGNISAINHALGRAYSLSGMVKKGDQRGRLLGFPTANLNVPKVYLPKHGVYLVKVMLDKPYYGVANLGVRPTVDGTKLSLEVHILSFSQDIYGKKIQVEFLQRIRGEKRFDSLEQLRQQINDDVDYAQSYLASLS